jgi:hypothetical protein
VIGYISLWYQEGEFRKIDRYHAFPLGEAIDEQVASRLKGPELSCWRIIWDFSAGSRLLHALVPQDTKGWSGVSLGVE